MIQSQATRRIRSGLAADVGKFRLEAILFTSQYVTRNKKNVY